MGRRERGKSPTEKKHQGTFKCGAGKKRDYDNKELQKFPGLWPPEERF